MGRRREVYEIYIDEENSANVALGGNHTIGGMIESEVQLDGVILNPTVEIDGQLIVNKGVLLLLD